MTITTPTPRPGGKILFIAYHFPPSAAVGGRRIANFAAGVRSLGWEPLVLTIADENIEHLDRTRLAEVQGIRLHKAAVRRTMASAAGRLWQRFRGNGRAGTAKSPAPADAGGSASRAPRSRLRRLVLSLLALPDWERGWIVPATLRGLRILRADGVDWFMTSCPPYSVHLIGLALKTLTGRRWVADFRDPWMTTGSKRLYPTSPVSMRIERFLERRVVERADLVVFNVDRLRNAYRDRYASVDARKFVYIPNGLARTPRAAAEKFETFTISYTGSLYVGRSPEPALAAVSRLVRLGRIPADRIRVMLIGHCDVIDGVPTSAVVQRHGLEAIVQIQPPIPYGEAFAIIQRSHLALLLAPNLPYQIPAKVYDYLAAGTRILAIAEEGGTADLLQETRSGRAFRSDETDAIADFIESEFRLGGASTLSHAALARYDVDHISAELVDHLAARSSQAMAEA